MKQRQKEKERDTKKDKIVRNKVERKIESVKKEK